MKMDRESELELHKDFGRWTELVDRAAHAQNEVDRAIPALQAVELEQKWIYAGEHWRTLRESYYLWYEYLARVRKRTDANIRAAIRDHRS
ncbi:hypothetical protein IU427_33310 [Nocardia beijingensis]|uniref:hypothetical protein n=1 Tax=Nocardia beijingensis TaxID=95162 RepID=UPI0018935204|nr:hypothetical protein [Nocardia beijingensis]MBF6469997.1 hypothetical protein [Nocardia beijingensis]